MSSPEGAQIVQQSFVFFFSKALHRWLQLSLLWDTVMLFPLEYLSKWSPDSLKTWWGEKHLRLILSGHRQFCGSKRQSQVEAWTEWCCCLCVTAHPTVFCRPSCQNKIWASNSSLGMSRHQIKIVEIFLTHSPKCLHGWNITIMFLLIADVSHPGSV